MSRGRPPKIDSAILQCVSCQEKKKEKDFSNSNNILFENCFKYHKKIPYCKDCINKLYNHYVKEYSKESVYPENKAIKKICMMFDLYYNDKIYNKAVEGLADKPSMTLISLYLNFLCLVQYKKKNYDTTLDEMKNEDSVKNDIIDINHNESNDTKKSAVSKKTIKFFGEGFSDEDYKFLEEQYGDWTTRHECNTKSQEEIFKDICYNRLQNLKAMQRGEDTKDISAAFQKMLDSGNLQPKQNAGDTMSDAQTFGTLIDKWENTRPIPEVEESLKDVDKIGLLIHTFYTGHIAKVLNLPSSLTALYDKFIKKYTVEKQEYSSDSDNEALFNSIFGKKNIDEQDTLVE